MVAYRPLALVLLVIAALPLTGAVGSSKFVNISNSCAETVWPAISSAASSAAPYTTGFELAPEQWKLLTVPWEWTGCVWGRTLCSTNFGGRFSCVTGDCRTGHQDCAGISSNPSPPVTLAQFRVVGNGSRGMQVFSYDVSVVDGFNIPMLLVASEETTAGGYLVYTIIFCPRTSSAKQPSTNPSNQPLIDGSTTPSAGDGQEQEREPWRIALVIAVLGAVTAAIGVLANLLGLFKLCFGLAKVETRLPNNS